ncbi:MAG: lysophospholipid acyltransferase family protein [Bacillota bacterium]|nr:lysophospholipid acyltransferase family protein [Bacillota bacterium]
MLYRALRAIAVALVKIFFPYKVSGREYLDVKGPLIAISNHTSMLDPLVLGVVVKRTIAYIAKIELFKHPFARWLLLKVNAIPVNRHGSDVSAIKQSLRVLKGGGAIGIFPEGTRGKTAEIRPFERGLGFIAIKSGATILPVRFKKLYKIFRGQTVVIGKPFKLDGFDTEPITMESVSRATEICENAMKAL